MLLTVPRWCLCCLCHHEVQPRGVWSNTLCTQRGQCARRPLCLLCQYVRAAMPSSLPLPGDSWGREPHPPSSACPLGWGADHSSQDTDFLSSLFGLKKKKKKFAVECTCVICQPRGLSQSTPPLYPVDEEREGSQHPQARLRPSQASHPARPTAGLTSNIQ